MRIQLRAKGITEIEFVGPPGGTGTDEYRQINPTGKIPALEVDGVVIAESAAICEYIEERWPEPALLPEDLMARAQVRMLVKATDLYVTTPMFKTIPQLTARPRNQEYLDLLLDELKSGLGYLETFRERSGFAGKTHAIGETLSLADGAIAGALLFVYNFAIPAFKLGDIVPAGLSDLSEALKKDPFCGLALEEIGRELKAKQGR